MSAIDPHFGQNPIATSDTFLCVVLRETVAYFPSSPLMRVRGHFLARF